MKKCRRKKAPNGSSFLPSLSIYEPVLSTSSIRHVSESSSENEEFFLNELSCSSIQSEHQPTTNNTEILLATKQQHQSVCLPSPPPQAIGSRSDLSLIRYNQIASKRLRYIQPIFQDRREKEAEIAKVILASRKLKKQQTEIKQEEISPVEKTCETSVLPPAEEEAKKEDNYIVVASNRKYTSALVRHQSRRQQIRRRNSMSKQPRTHMPFMPGKNNRGDLAIYHDNSSDREELNIKKRKKRPIATRLLLEKNVILNEIPMKLSISYNSGRYIIISTNNKRFRAIRFLLSDILKFNCTTVEAEVLSSDWCDQLCNSVCANKDQQLFIKQFPPPKIIFQESSNLPNPEEHCNSIVTVDSLQVLQLKLEYWEENGAKESKELSYSFSNYELQRILLASRKGYMLDENANDSASVIDKLISNEDLIKNSLLGRNLYQLLLLKRYQENNNNINEIFNLSEFRSTMHCGEGNEVPCRRSLTVACNKMFLDRQTIVKNVLSITQRISRDVVENSIQNVYRWIHQGISAMQLAASYLRMAYSDSDNTERMKVEKYVQTKTVEAKLKLRANDTYIDMLDDIILFESRIELDFAKYSGGYDDFFATKLQVFFRKRIERLCYLRKINSKINAAKLIQALRRGIIARNRHAKDKFLKERSLIYGGSGYLNYDNPISKLKERSNSKNCKRLHILQQIFTGFAVENRGSDFIQVSSGECNDSTMAKVQLDIVCKLLNDSGILVGCPNSLGDQAVRTLKEEFQSDSMDNIYVSWRDVKASLFAVLPNIWDDMYGVPIELLSSKKEMFIKGRGTIEDKKSRRKAIKISPNLHQSARETQLALEASKLRMGRKVAHFMSVCFHEKKQEMDLEAIFSDWEADMKKKHTSIRTFAQCSKSTLTNWGMERLQESITDWGIDADSLFDVFNSCLTHRYGKLAMSEIERIFNCYVDELDQNSETKGSIHYLREEIAEELQGLEKLVAIRYLNFCLDGEHVTSIGELIPLLMDKAIDNNCTLHRCVPTVIEYLSLSDKTEISRRLLCSYSGPADGKLFLQLIDSCFDVAGHATLEAGLFVTLLASFDLPVAQAKRQTLLGKALFSLVEEQHMRLLRRLVKVSYVNENVHNLILEHLMCPVAYALCTLTDVNQLKHMENNYFNKDIVCDNQEFLQKYKEIQPLLSTTSTNSSKLNI